MNEGIYEQNTGLALFMRLYARFLVCPCMDNHCLQCKIDIDEMGKSKLIPVAARIDPQIYELKRKAAGLE